MIFLCVHAWEWDLNFLFWFNISLIHKKNTQPSLVVCPCVLICSWVCEFLCAWKQVHVEIVECVCVYLNWIFALLCVFAGTHSPPRTHKHCWAVKLLFILLIETFLWLFCLYPALSTRTPWRSSWLLNNELIKSVLMCEALWLHHTWKVHRLLFSEGFPWKKFFCFSL